MWEIEALMENTIKLIDKSSASPSEKRKLIRNTYDLQNEFDCSFTHFRVMDILLKNQYVQQYDIDDFPMTNNYPSYFNELSNKDFEWIRNNPTLKWSKENISVAYWDKKSNKIYADFGSKYYSNKQTESISKIEPIQFGIVIMEEALRQNEKSSIYDWTSFITLHLLEIFPPSESIEQLKEGKFKIIKTLFQKFDYSDYKAIHLALDIYYNTKNEYLSDTQKELLRFIIE